MLWINEYGCLNAEKKRHCQKQKLNVKKGKRNEQATNKYRVKCVFKGNIFFLFFSVKRLHRRMILRYNYGHNITNITSRHDIY